MEKRKTFVAVAAWGFYLVIVLEFLYMISPFALYFYSAYGPALNLLHRSPSTSWLTAFFLPTFPRRTAGCSMSCMKWEKLSGSWACCFLV